jgi:hypothetical protein
VYQTPTSQAVKDAEADVGDLPDKGRATSFISSLTSRISRAASFHASHSDLQKLDTSAAPRARTLAFSKSQPDLKAAMSVGLPPAGLVVLGKEARRRSRRYVQSEDGTLVAQHPGLFASDRIFAFLWTKAPDDLNLMVLGMSFQCQAAVKLQA